MLNEWMNWVSSLRTQELLIVLSVLLLVDAPRYAYSAVVMAIWDLIRHGGPDIRSSVPISAYTFRPPVSVIIAGYNEASTIARTMESVWSRYPEIQMIVVDDGSTDGMAETARRCAEGRNDVVVLRRERRGGKSSALNMGLHYAAADYVVTIDADSQLGETAIYEMLQPLRDPQVAAVSASILAWNPFASLAAMLQAYEYRQTIFVSRMFRGRVGVLGIVSGAFGAFRTDVIRSLGGWDVGPGEDGDLVLRIRKAGFRVAVAPYANCFTNVPTSWIRLFRQRCRWDRTVVTFECRKHNDLGCPWGSNFRWSDFTLMAERWFFNVICVYVFWLYGIWLMFAGPPGTLHLMILLYLCGLGLEFLQLLVLLFYTDRLKHDLILATALPLYPLYQIFMKTVDGIALTAEILFRSSGDDNFVPVHVRQSTWRW